MRGDPGHDVHRCRAQILTACASAVRVPAFAGSPRRGAPTESGGGPAPLKEMTCVVAAQQQQRKRRQVQSRHRWRNSRRRRDLRETLNYDTARSGVICTSTRNAQRVLRQRRHGDTGWASPVERHQYRPSGARWHKPRSSNPPRPAGASASKTLSDNRGWHGPFEP